MTKQQRNFYIVCAVLVVGGYVVSSINQAAQLAAFMRQQAIRAVQQRGRAQAQAKVKAEREATARAKKEKAAPGAPARRPPAVVLTTLSNLAGVWKGQGCLVRARNLLAPA